MIANRKAHCSARALAIVLGLVCVVPVAAATDSIDLRRMQAVHGDANSGKTRATACMGCHGAVGIAPVPMFPNLAGQHAEYLYWQLVEFKREARPESPMTAQVATLDDAAMRDVATYFSSLPGAGTSSQEAPTARGASLYREGNPASGAPPCQGCHGAQATGHPLAQDDVRYRGYPVLRGQHAAYLAARLKDFRDGKHTLSSNDRIMTSVAHTLDDDSIQALSLWIESGAR
ncbi:MAG: c-type cytochrome [Dokdonella sp.]